MTATYNEQDAPAQDTPHTTGDRARGDTQVPRLLTLAESARLFKTPDDNLYAELPIGDRWETHPLASMAVRDWLTYTYRKAFNTVPNKTALESTLDAMRATARYEAPTQEVYLRVAWQHDTLYLDLANEVGEVVEVTAFGWRIISELPVTFRRSKSMQPLPRPVQGGKIDELRPFLNLSGEEDWVLVVSWLLGTLHPTGPYPVLTLYGEKGSAKTSTTRNLRGLVDPSVAPVPVQPKDSDALTLKAHHNHIVAFDNMSSMPRWMSDGLCRLATGAGDSKRAHYENTDEIIFSAKRPAIINGIEELATAGDLLDRVIMVTLPQIGSARRKSERELTTAYEQARPRILGALLDAVVVALRNRDNVHLNDAPRMKDFAEWVAAGETAFGWRPGTFLAAYKANQATAAGLELEASSVGLAVLKLMERQRHWTGTATTLLKELDRYREGGGLYTPYGWPRDGKGLSGQLTRAAGALRSRGITFTRGKSGDRSITLGHVVEDDLGVEDDDSPQFPTLKFKEKEREEAGKLRELASVASTSSTGEVDAWGRSEDDPEYFPF